MKVNERPKIEFSKDQFFIWMDIVSIVIILVGIIVLMVNYPNLPEEIPIHYNLNGEVDDWASKKYVFVMPALFALIMFGLNRLRKVPHLFNYPVKLNEQNVYEMYSLSRKLLAWIQLVIAAMVLMDIIGIVFQKQLEENVVLKNLHFAMHWMVLVVIVLFIIRMIVKKRK